MASVVSDELVFEPLPARFGFERSVDPIIQRALPQLRAKPNAWARVKSAQKKSPEAKQLTGLANRVNSGKAAAFGTDFAACIRTVNATTTALYMRYVGDDEGK